MRQRINYIFLIAACFLFSLTACERDNYDGPNGSFSGSIKDVVTKELVGTDVQNGSAIRAYEQGFPTLTAQTWIIKQNGEFRNDMVFAGKYNIEFINGNFYPFTTNDVVINAGTNVKDFEVTPYIRIKSPSITYDAAGKRIVATFRLEGGKAEVKVGTVRLYAFTDIYVGEQVKLTTTGTGFSQTLTGAAQTIDPNATYTLTIDLTANANLFSVKRNYYFRIGALSIVPNVGTIRHNYSPTIMIAL